MKVQPCAADLQSCPDRGCAEPRSVEALANQLKRRWPASTEPIILGFDDLERLQGAADALVGQGVLLNEQARQKLRSLRSSSGPGREGDFVQMVGYVVSAPYYVKKGESVNCDLTGPENNDLRIAIARGPRDTDFDGISVVMIPYWRPRGWNVESLLRVAKEQHLVLVRGQLFYDSEHQVNDDPDVESPGQPRRFSLWEIHPVTDFYVCMPEGTSCDARHLKEWERLELALSRPHVDTEKFTPEEVQEETIR